MIDNIKLKIKQKLEKGVNLEDSDVLFILIYCRKILELSNNKSPYNTLLFYSNWVAHPRIDRKSNFLENLNKNIKLISVEKGLGAIAIFGFISFIDFRNDFIRFLKQQIDDTLLDVEILRIFDLKLKTLVEDTIIDTTIDNTKVTIYFNKNSELVIENLPNNPKLIKLEILSNR